MFRTHFLSYKPRMADGPIIDIDPSAFRDDEKLKPLGALSIETGKLREVFSF